MTHYSDETDFGSVENGMRHSRSILLLYGSAEQSRGVQDTDGRDSTVWQMDQRMEFSLVEREC